MQLHGIRVVDLSRILSGPFCSMFLADMGAEVIKVEGVGDGDPVRRQGHLRNGFSLYFASFNRNKRSMTLDLRSDEGKDVLRKLIATADVVLDNFRPGVMERIGLSRAELERIRPDIVSCHITGFGMDGPYRDRPSFDFIAQAMSGFMSVNGAEGEPPMRAAPPLSDLIAGAYAAMGVCAALVRRERTGRGEEVATALTDSMIANLAFLATHYFETGEQPLRTGNDHALVAPYGLFEAADGEVAIAPSNDQVYHRLLDVLGLAELRSHPEFLTNRDRFARRGAINAIINSAIGRQPIAHWLDVLNAAGVPCGRVMGLKEVFDDPQVRHQQMKITIEHPEHGPLDVLGFPIKFTDDPCRMHRPPPDLGADTDDILGELGFDADEVSALHARRIA
ncbi:itaconate CoA-transferase [Burkholderiales bacterium]|nr:itaconate CoA-transferase [Burkholderiales bacterium]